MAFRARRPARLPKFSIGCCLRMSGDIARFCITRETQPVGIYLRQSAITHTDDRIIRNVLGNAVRHHLNAFSGWTNWKESAEAGK